jgi:hypothetical protein
MRTATLSVVLLAACAGLPPATAAPGHGLERVWIETLGLE